MKKSAIVILFVFLALVEIALYYAVDRKLTFKSLGPVLGSIIVYTAIRAVAYYNDPEHIKKHNLS